MTLHETKEIRRIVVGIDEAGLADPAVAMAMDLAEAFDARLEIVHAVHIDPMLRGVGSASQWSELANQTLTAARKKIEGHLDVSIDRPRFAEEPVTDLLHVKPGNPSEVLLERAEENQADLIVIGPHRHRKILDFGGTARGLLGHTPRPVWVQPQPPAKIRRILAPIDLSEGSAVVLRMAGLLAQAFGAEATAMHVHSPPGVIHGIPYVGMGSEPPPNAILKAIKKATHEEFERIVADCQWETNLRMLFAEGDPWHEVLEQQDSHDLIVVGPHSRTGLTRALLGSQAYRILKGAHVPVLAVPSD